MIKLSAAFFISDTYIGTDTKMAKPYPKSKGQMANSNDRPGEKTNTAWQNQKEGFYYALVSEMLNIGFAEKEIAKVGGGNFCSVFDAATVGH